MLSQPILVFCTLAAIVAPAYIQHVTAGNGCRSSTGGNAISQDNKCFCDAEADRLIACIKKVAPNWPMEVQTGDPNRVCPDPAVNPTGFNQCTNEMTPKTHPQVREIFDNCVASEKPKLCGAGTQSAAIKNRTSWSHLLISFSLWLAIIVYIV